MLYALGSAFGNITFEVLRLLQRHWTAVSIYIYAIAILSPICAYFDRKKDSQVATKEYIRNNLVFNMLGALSACTMYYLAHILIPDFGALKEFEIESVVSIFVPACWSFVYLYQQEEQNNPKVRDHNTSIEWKNQRINMLHLFNVYFFSILSAVYVVAYTVYCRIHNRALVLNGSYIVYLIMVLVFFFVLSFHEYEYLFMIFQVDVPAILISSVFWMTWFENADDYLFGEICFILIVFMAYVLRLFTRYRIIVFNHPEIDSDEYKIKIFRNRIMIKSAFYIISTLFMIVSYVFILVIPWI